jgi:hypothetical protein
MILARGSEDPGQGAPGLNDIMIIDIIGMNIGMIQSDNNIN